MATEKEREAERRFYARMKQDPVRWARYQERRRAHANRQPAAKRKYYVDNLALVLLGAARRRAKKKGLPFTITVDDIVIPTNCPILGVPLEVARGAGAAANSPSLDRIDCTQGYVRGNVMVISFRANSLKSNGTAAEMRKVADWLAENEF